MKQLKNSILILLIVMLLSTIYTPVLATNEVSTQNVIENISLESIDKSDKNLQDVNTKSPSCMLIDSKTGEILYAKKAYDKMYPASTTKLMTAILVLENCKLSDVVTVSHNAVFSIPMGYAHANLKEGEELTVEQLLNVLLIPSANDAAIALAEHVAGSVEEFSVMMNNKAKELGCISTNFVNPNGIHDKNHYSCAYDLSLIGQYAMKFSDIMRIAKIRQYTLPITNKHNKANRIFNATNALLTNTSSNKNYYEYATGLKTGYTDSAGSCIVSTAKKGDVELLVVILKGSSINSRYSDCKTLFEYGFNNYSYIALQKAENIINTIEIKNATKDSKFLDIVLKEDISVLLKNTVDTDSIEPSIEINSELKAPIAKNTVVGKISYNIDGKIYEEDLVAGSDVIPSTLEVIIFNVLLIFLILYILSRLLRHTGNIKPKKKQKNNTSKKKKNKSKKTEKKSSTTSKEKGNIKFTQINDYL